MIRGVVNLRHEMLEGEITQNEFLACVVRHAVPEQIEAFMAQCPADLLAALRERLEMYDTATGIGPVTFRLGTYAPWVTDDEIAESQRQDQERVWRGVRLLKGYID